MKQVACKPISLVGAKVVYRGEGNANLVVALTDRRIVLRFPKSKFADKSQDEKLQCIARYVNNVMIPELGENYVQQVNIGVISYQDLEDIKEAVKYSRPPQRCNKDIFFPKSLIMRDLALPSLEMEACTMGTVLSVELKPKQGYRLLRNCVHQSLCNFCMKQWYKLETNRIEERSHYCPLDLYSGEPENMSRAIDALIQSPQNNLRVFRNGELMHGEDRVTEQCLDFLTDFFDGEGKLSFNAVLIRALLSEEQNQCHNSQKSRESHPSNCDKEKSHLPLKCILQAVLNLQKKTSITDSEALDILNDLLGTMDDITDLQRLITKPNKEGTKSSPNSDKIRLLRNYMLAVTAKDLSIILTVREAKAGADASLIGHHLRVRNKLFCYSWSIVDLDPKQLTRISKYVSQKHLWLEAFRKRNNQELLVCKENVKKN